MRHVKSFLASLPHAPGAYQMLDDTGMVLYVGKAKDLKNRLSQYFNQQTKDPKTQSLLQALHDIEITITKSETEAILLECALIKRQHPKYNILLRDDKSFPYIVISKHKYPRLELYRGTRKREGQFFGPYPDTHAVRKMIQLLQKIFRLRTCRDTSFKIRTRPCLLYQIKRCTAPCVQYISEKDYAESVKMATLFLEGKNEAVMQRLKQDMESAAHHLEYEKAVIYRDQINRIRQIQEKQPIFVNAVSTDVIGLATQAGIIAMQLLTIRQGQLLGSKTYFPSLPLHWEVEEVLRAFITQHYLDRVQVSEWIPKCLILPINITDHLVIANTLSQSAEHIVKLQVPNRGMKKEWLRMAMQNAEESLSIYLSTKMDMQARFKALQALLALQVMPKRIECFDISHTQGEATVGSCVVFDQSGPLKQDYRRYNMRTTTHGDDLLAMEEVLLRRYQHSHESGATDPDLIIIDGGETQLAVACKVLKKLQLDHIRRIAISKGVERKPGLEMIHEPGKAAYRVPSHSLGLHLLQHIRDEAHRFAIAGHRMRRDKKSRESILESIPGVGAKRRGDLLRYFGGIQGVARASLEKLMNVPGINMALAERIFSALHDATL